MDIKTYSTEAWRTCAVLENYQQDVLHMVLGMVTEVGELADVYKKSLAYKKEIDWVNVEEEIGDLMWYIVNFCAMENLDLEAILEENIEKLRTRYPEEFTEHHANNRNLKKERDTLEKK